MQRTLSLPGASQYGILFLLAHGGTLQSSFFSTRRVMDCVGHAPSEEIAREFRIRRGRLLHF